MSVSKHICVVTPCYNEVENVRELYVAIKLVFEKLPEYTYTHLYIDNASKDGTDRILRELAAADPNVKVIFNARNFGHIRSPYHGLIQLDADATVILASDFQDPPSMIPDFLRRWEEGYKIVIGVKVEQEESRLMYFASLRVLRRRQEARRHRAHAARHGFRPLRPPRHRDPPRDRRPLSLRPGPDRGHRPWSLQIPYTQPQPAAGASPRTISTRSTTSRYWGSPTIPRSRSALRPWRGSSWRGEPAASRSATSWPSSYSGSCSLSVSPQS